MKINSVYIEAFGGLKQKTIDFSDGFNIIYGPNENGKTTVMNFIKMMFYGSERGTQTAAGNTRKKYTPWDGTKPAGSIDFEHGGKKYRIEREWRGSNSTDKVTLLDIATGTRQTVSPDIGEKFFSLSLEAFRRSVFIGQSVVSENDAAAEGEINSKLSNLASTGDGDISFDKVNARLEKAKLALKSKSGRAGEYDKNLKLLAELQAEYGNSVSLMKELELKKEKITAIDTELAELKIKNEKLKAQISAENDIRNAEKLKRYLELKKELDAANSELKLSDGSAMDEISFGKLKFCVSRVSAAKSKQEAKLSEVETLKKSIEAGLNPPQDASAENAEIIRNSISQLEAKVNDGKISSSEQELKNITDTAPKKYTAVKVVSAVLFAAVLAAAVCVNMLFSVGAVLPVALFIFAVVKQKKAAEVYTFKKEKLSSEIEALKREKADTEKELFTLRTRLEAINTALNTTAAVLENQQNMMKEYYTQYEALKYETEQYEKEAKEVYSKYSTAENYEEIISALPSIEEKMQRVKELKNELNYTARDLGGISYKEAESKLKRLGDKAYGDTDFEALKESFETSAARISELAAAKSALIAEARVSIASVKDPEALKRKIAELKEKVEAEEKFCTLCELAQVTLAESFAEIRESYGSQLEKKAADIFSRLTKGKYSSVSISKSFDIGVTEKGIFGNRESEFLSSGTEDQVYLSLRLALSELMSENGERLPVLLDDALAQYDDEREQTALEFLKEYSEKHQIILFTCHKNTADKAEKLSDCRVQVKNFA